MQGEYTQALELYQQLINLAMDLEVSASSTDQDSLYYLASAFQNLVKIQSSLPEQSTTELIKVIDFGLKWLARVQKSEWSASLRLQKSLLLWRWKGHLEEACLELQGALGF